MHEPGAVHRLNHRPHRAVHVQPGRQPAELLTLRGDRQLGDGRPVGLQHTDIKPMPRQVQPNMQT
jgi:hypothetical protein